MLLDPQRWASTPSPTPPLKRSRDDERRRKKRKKHTGSAEITSRGFSPPEPSSASHPKEMKAHERNVFLRSVNAWVNIHSFIYLFSLKKIKNAHNYFSCIAFLPVNSS